MYSSFTKKELENSINKIENLIIKTLPEDKVDYEILRKKSVQFFKKVFEINQKEKLKTKLLFIPQ
jgi:predicted metallo-beta-lactamase superfamily hydrolase